MKLGLGLGIHFIGSIAGSAFGSFPPITSLAFLGDSTTAEAGELGISPLYPSATATESQAAWANYVQFALGRRLPIVEDYTATPPLVAFARGGQKSDHVLGTQIPALLAAPTLPSHAVWKIGTNDISQSYPIASSESNIRSGIALLKAAGITNIITTINPRTIYATETEAFNDLLATIAAETGSIFIDSRSVLESAPGVAAKLCLYDDVHQWGTANMALAADFVDKLQSRFVNDLEDPFDMGPLLHTQSNITSTPPAGQTTSQTTIARDDGIAGNWYRCVISSSPSISIGTGNSGISYAPIAPETLDTVRVYHRTTLGPNQNFPFSGPKVPRISVTTTDDGRKLIEVRSATTGSTALTTASEVVAAIAAHPEASLLVTPTLLGNGSGVIAQGDSWNAWSLLLANAATNPVAGKWVRLICEIRNGSPAQAFSVFRLWRTTPFNAGLRSARSNASSTGLMIPSRKWVLTTPWYQVQSGDSGWRGQINFGGSLGTYDIGRFGVQVYEP